MYDEEESVQGWSTNTGLSTVGLERFKGEMFQICPQSGSGAEGCGCGWRWLMDYSLKQ